MFFNNCCTLAQQKALFRGQFISILIAGTGVFATLMAALKVNFNYQTLMSLFCYVLLSTFLFRYKCNACNIPSTIQPKESITPKYCWYFLAAVLDLEANFLVTTAYQYTSVTSIMFLDCFTIPCVMTLSFFLLNYRYKYKHMSGTIVCTTGLGIIILCDFFMKNNNSSPNPLLGDLLCLVGSALYACSNVLQETLIKVNTRDTYLGYLGLFGSFLALIQFLLLDISIIKGIVITGTMGFYITGFVLCLFFMYVNTSQFLQDHESTLFNLSLLTSDVYAIIFSYFLYGRLVHWLYFIAFGLCIMGIIIYHSEISPTITSNLIIQEKIPKIYDDLESKIMDDSSLINHLKNTSDIDVPSENLEHQKLLPKN